MMILNCCELKELELVLSHGHIDQCTTHVTLPLRMRNITYARVSHLFFFPMLLSYCTYFAQILPAKFRPTFG